MLAVIQNYVHIITDVMMVFQVLIVNQQCQCLVLKKTLKLLYNQIVGQL